MISVDKLEKNIALNRKFQPTMRVAPKAGDCTPSQATSSNLTSIRSSESHHSLMTKCKPQIGTLSQSLISKRFRVKEDKVDETIIEHFVMTPQRSIKVSTYDQQETTIKETTEQTDRWVSDQVFSLDRIKISRSFSFFNEYSAPRNSQEIELMYQGLSDFKITRPNRN